MPPTEQSAPADRVPDLSWPQLLEHAKSYRSETRRFAHSPVSNAEFIFDKDATPKIYALGAFDQGSSQQTILCATLSNSDDDQKRNGTFQKHARISSSGQDNPAPVTDDSEGHFDAPDIDYNRIPENCPSTTLQPIFLPQTITRNPSEVPKEVTMLCERMRTSVGNGVTDFTYSANGNCILYDSSLNLNLLKLNDNETHPIGKWCDGAPLNAQLSPFDASLTAFLSNGELHIDKDGKKYHSTESRSSCVTSGASSFISQEELDRFDGFWWSPTRPELVYEVVDESSVAELAFECPGKPLASLMRYPLAGTSNAISKLRLLNCADENPIDCPLFLDIQHMFPWCEYLARVGWFPDGSGIYIQLLNRLQSKAALVYFPRGLFCKVSSIINLEELKKQVHVLYTESCPRDAWINVNNLLSPLPPAFTGDFTKRFIYGSERSGNNHLYFHIYSRDAHGLPVADLYTVTEGDWNVVRESPISVDNQRNLVYYLANIYDPTSITLCVSSYAKRSYEADEPRTRSKLCLNVDYGFVCWLSSISSPPECYIYRLKFNEDSKNTPVAVVHSKLVLPKPNNIVNAYSDFRLSMDQSLFGSIPPHSHPMFHSYVSKNSGYKHYGLILRPFNFKEGLRYPTIHHVYGGPGVQLVRNCWSTWIQFLKYTSVGFCVILIDGRGSSNRGINFEKPIKNAMGTVEVADQVEGLLEIAQHFQCIDLNRVGVTGWSYGGYMALLLLANHPSLYRCSAAGGAVVDWRLYDTCYTERYMGVPDDIGTDVYGNSSVLAQVSKLPDETGRLLIVHGFMDENVHFHHTENLLEALTKAGKHYQLLLFPSEHHGIRQSTAGEYLDANIILFFKKALQD
ncbi:hypothetical protein QR680_009247 [Steinernema hermaphroditum]|uniref:Dipeptidyl peptidase 9 n=1 Tax=Steinernema hermaphroditum TaxID=289476 RepID=A0AA39IM00_9BILA|nr:hypothetical protein QR680_009247 [Steinernema hermaphroditum]